MPLPKKSWFSVLIDFPPRSVGHSLMSNPPRASEHVLTSAPGIVDEEEANFLRVVLNWPASFQDHSSVILATLQSHSIVIRCSF
jgi:hypothetical protein